MKAVTSVSLKTANSETNWAKSSIFCQSTILHPLNTNLTASIVMTPQWPDFVLPTNIPQVQSNIFVFDSFYVESHSGKRGKFLCCFYLAVNFDSPLFRKITNGKSAKYCSGSCQWLFYWFVSSLNEIISAAFLGDKYSIINIKIHAWYRIVVLPALSSPSIRIRSSFFLKLDTPPPILNLNNQKSI